MLKIKNTKNG